MLVCVVCVCDQTNKVLTLTQTLSMAEQAANVSSISASLFDRQPCPSTPQPDSAFRRPANEPPSGARPEARNCATRFIFFLVTFFVINFLVLFLFNDRPERSFLNLLIGFTVLALVVILIFTIVEIRNFYRQNGILFWGGGGGGGHDDVARLMERRRTRSSEPAEVIDAMGRGLTSGRLVRGEDLPPAYEAPPDYQQLCVLGLVSSPEASSEHTAPKADIP